MTTNRDEDVARAIARWLISLRASEDVRLTTGDRAIEHAADSLRCEASAGLPEVRAYGMDDAVVDMEAADSTGAYSAVALGEETRPGDEVLVDGVWFRWVGGDEARHPAWDVLGRRPWRRKKEGEI